MSETEKIQVADSFLLQCPWCDAGAALQREEVMTVGAGEFLHNSAPAPSPSFCMWGAVGNV